MARAPIHGSVDEPTSTTLQLPAQRTCQQRVVRTHPTRQVPFRSRSTLRQVRPESTPAHWGYTLCAVDTAVRGCPQRSHRQPLSTVAAEDAHRRHLLQGEEPHLHGVRGGEPGSYPTSQSLGTGSRTRLSCHASAASCRSDREIGRHCENPIHTGCLEASQRSDCHRPLVGVVHDRGCTDETPYVVAEAPLTKVQL